MAMMQDTNESMHEQSSAHPATYPRYVVAALATGGGYVVYDRWQARVADGRYLSVDDAQWAADQRNQRQQWQTATMDERSADAHVQEG